MNLEDRVKQIPEPGEIYHRQESQKTTAVLRDPAIENIDQEIKKIEDSLLKTDIENEKKMQKISQLSTQKRSRNPLVNYPTDPISHLHTYRAGPIDSFALDNPDLASRSLIDIRTKPQNNSQKPRPLSSKKPQKSPRILPESEIFIRISIRLSEEVDTIVNVYKNDTAYSVADRCISNQVNRLKVSLILLFLGNG